MKRNIVSVICLMIVAVLVFASCAKKNNSKLHVAENGATYLALTDENGETVTDVNGSVIVIPTDKDGEKLTNKYGQVKTEVVDPGYQVSSNGKKIETSAYTLKVPNGWVVNTDTLDYVQVKKGDLDSKVSLDIHLSRVSYENAVEEMKTLHKQFVDSVENVTENEEKEIKLQDGAVSPVYRISFAGSNVLEDGKENTVGYRFYVFNMNGFTYSVICGAIGEKEISNADFEAVLNAIIFK